MLGSQKQDPVRLPMRLAAALSLVLVVAAPAFAQDAGALVSDLRKGVPCQASAARAAMEANVGKATAAAADVDKALTDISANTSICNALRDAASEIGKARAGSIAAVAAGSSPSSSSPAVPEGLSQASRDAVAAALAAAEHNVNNLKFEVGPPPPIAAKGRNSGS